MTKREHAPETLPEGANAVRESEAGVVAGLWFAILNMPLDSKKRANKIEEAQSAYNALDEEGQVKAGYLFEELKKAKDISSPVFTKKP